MSICALRTYLRSLTLYHASIKVSCHSLNEFFEKHNPFAHLLISNDCLTSYGLAFRQ